MKQDFTQLSLPHIPPKAPPPARDTRVVMAICLLTARLPAEFAKMLGIEIYYVSLTLNRYLGQKLAELSHRGYASIVAPLDARQRPLHKGLAPCTWSVALLDGDPVHDLPASQEAQLPASDYRDGVVRFRLPHHVRFAEIEVALSAALADRNLNLFLTSSAGRQALARAGLPANARLFSDYRDSDGFRRSLASELYVIRKAEFSSLLDDLAAALNEKRRWRRFGAPL